MVCITTYHLNPALSAGKQVIHIEVKGGPHHPLQHGHVRPAGHQSLTPANAWDTWDLDVAQVPAAVAHVQRGRGAGPWQCGLFGGSGRYCEPVLWALLV